MKKLEFMALLWISILVGTISQANVVSINVYPEDPPWEAIHGWFFDYNLQVLTTYDAIFGEANGRYVGWDSLIMSGLVDSDSTFAIIRNITNNTGVTWTGYELYNMPGRGGGGWFVSGSAQSTHLQTITYPDGHAYIEFSEPPPVLDGESFTIEFDFYVPYIPEGGFLNRLGSVAIPEPATISLVTLGALALLRRRKVQNNHHVPI